MSEERKAFESWCGSLSIDEQWRYMLRDAWEAACAWQRAQFEEMMCPSCLGRRGFWSSGDDFSACEDCEGAGVLYCMKPNPCLTGLKVQKKAEKKP